MLDCFEWKERGTLTIRPRYGLGRQDAGLIEQRHHAFDRLRIDRRLWVEDDVEVQPLRSDAHTPGAVGEGLDVRGGCDCVGDVSPAGCDILDRVVSDAELQIDIAPGIPRPDGESTHQVDSQDPVVCSGNRLGSFDQSLLWFSRGRPEPFERMLADVIHESASADDVISVYNSLGPRSNRPTDWGSHGFVRPTYPAVVWEVMPIGPCSGDGVRCGVKPNS